MQLGLNLPVIHPGATPAVLLELARAAEALGFHEVFAGEHAVLFDDPEDAYPGGDGTLPFPPTSPLPDPLLLHAFLAAGTSRIRLATGVLLLSQRNPIYAAKHLGTLDWLSDGRLDVGIGLGWSRTESELCGADWNDRAGRIEEHVELVRALWELGPTSHHGHRYTVPRVYQYPKPAQSGGPPIWIGGMSDAALDRVARIGDGWYGFGLTPDKARDRLRVLDRNLVEQGRSRSDITVVMGSLGPAPDGDRMRAFEEVGVDLLVVSIKSVDSPAAMHRELDGIAATARRG